MNRKLGTAQYGRPRKSVAWKQVPADIANKDIEIPDWKRRRLNKGAQAQTIPQPEHAPSPLLPHKSLKSPAPVRNPVVPIVPIPRVPVAPVPRVPVPVPVPAVLEVKKPVVAKSTLKKPEPPSRFFCPQQIKDIVGNDKAKTELTSWLTDVRDDIEETKRCCLLVGPHGIGKSTLAKVAIEEMGFTFLRFPPDSRNFDSLEEVSASLREILSPSSYFGKLGKIQTKQAIVVIDDVDNLEDKTMERILRDLTTCLAQYEQNNLSVEKAAKQAGRSQTRKSLDGKLYEEAKTKELEVARQSRIEEINALESSNPGGGKLVLVRGRYPTQDSKLRPPHIICTSTSLINRKLRKFSELSVQIKMFKPFANAISKWLQNGRGYSYQFAEEMAKTCGGDIAGLKNRIETAVSQQSLTVEYRKEKISTDWGDGTLKDSRSNIFEATDALLVAQEFKQSFQLIDNVLHAFPLDSGMMVLSMYENAITAPIFQECNGLEQFEQWADVMDGMSVADQLDSAFDDFDIHSYGIYAATIPAMRHARRKRPVNETGFSKMQIQVNYPEYNQKIFKIRSNMSLINARSCLTFKGLPPFVAKIKEKGKKSTKAPRVEDKSLAVTRYVSLREVLDVRACTEFYRELINPPSVDLLTIYETYVQA